MTESQGRHLRTLTHWQGLRRSKGGSGGTIPGRGKARQDTCKEQQGIGMSGKRDPPRLNTVLVCMRAQSCLTELGEALRSYCLSSDLKGGEDGMQGGLWNLQHQVHDACAC